MTDEKKTEKVKVKKGKKVMTEEQKEARKVKTRKVLKSVGKSTAVGTGVVVYGAAWKTFPKTMLGIHAVGAAIGTYLYKKDEKFKNAVDDKRNKVAEFLNKKGEEVAVEEESAK